MNKIEKNNINKTMGRAWNTWHGYTPEQKAERLSYLQQQIVQLKQQRAYAKSKVKTARTPEEQQVWRNTKTQIDKELLRVVAHEYDLRTGKKMTQGAKERAAIKRREAREKAKNRIIFQPQDDPYYNESKNMNKKLIRLTESDLHKIVKESVNRILREVTSQRKYFVKEVECYTEGGEDIVFVAALSKDGADGPAKRRVREKYPNLEIIQVYDVAGAIDVDDMTNAQYHFCEQGAIMLPNEWEGMTDVGDLEWIPELN